MGSEEQNILICVLLSGIKVPNQTCKETEVSCKVQGATVLSCKTVDRFALAFISVLPAVLQDQDAAT